MIMSMCKYSIVLFQHIKIKRVKESGLRTVISEELKNYQTNKNGPILFDCIH